jgi:hypothetical protein
MRQAASKLKMTVLALTILLISVIGILCSGGGTRIGEIAGDLKPHILEFKHVLHYKLVVNPDTKVPEKISGVCGASAYCVQGITTKTNGTALTVLVTIGLCKDNQTGGFSYPLKIADNITELKFGNDEHLLWKRHQSE